MSLSVDVPNEMRDKLEEKKERELYSSMSELVREALRNYLKTEGEIQDQTPKEEAIAEMIKDGRVEEVNLEGEAERKIKEGIEELESQ
jgi:Arc/MetJ-type ribon-helix-helix transcriptional regulator